MEESVRTLEQELYAQSNDSSDMQLAPDHEIRPCYVCKDGTIYVEMWHTGSANDANVYKDNDHVKRSNMSRIAAAFIIRFAEPQSRTEFMHQYRLTSYSVLAGLALRESDFLYTLQCLSKNMIPETVTKFVNTLASTYGRVKLVLRRGRVFVESQSENTLLRLLKNETIRSVRVLAGETALSNVITTTIAPKTLESTAKRQREDDKIEFIKNNLDRIDEMYEEELNLYTKDKSTGAFVNPVSFEIDSRYSSTVKEIAAQMGYPMLEEYEYNKDNLSPKLDMHLKNASQLRHYQRKALSMMFMRSRARSGTIVLPCGAGKTLTGIAAACTIGKSTIVLCCNTVACKQWIQQFMFYTDINPLRVIEFTAGEKVSLPMDGSAVVLATTYSMMSMRDDRRAASSSGIINQIRSREWGLLILDEVHMAPVDNFRLALSEVKTHCKLGLTATLVREDGQIGDLNFLVGPKLFEADWTQLTAEGYLARVICAEITCPMSPSYMRAYLYEQNSAKRDLLAVMNPIKFLVCKKLMESHEEQDDKVLIYSDGVISVQEYGIKLKRHFMYGSTSNAERTDLLRRFRMRPDPNVKYTPETSPISTLILSKIGDVAIDLPEANVLIQVSSHCGSRRQEAQRLGRILRPKANADSDQNRAVFYSLISQDTTEAGMHKDKRREYVQQQGYSYKTVTLEMLNMPPYEENEKTERVIIKELLSKKESQVHTEN